MPIDRPSPTELLEAVQNHLQTHVAPELEGQAAFHLKVAINALSIVERSLSHGDSLDQAERGRLVQLLKDPSVDLLALNLALADHIRQEDRLEDRQAILDHLRETAEAKLQLSNPKYLDTKT